MRPSLMLALCLSTVSAPACFGGQSGSDPAICETRSTSPLEPDAKSELGFSASDLLAAIGGVHEARLVWEGGGAVDLEVEVADTASEIRFVERELADSSEDIGHLEGVDGSCSDSLDLQLGLRLTTADGALDETWSATASARTAGAASASYMADLRALHGSYVVSEQDAARFDPSAALFSLEISREEVRGDVLGRSPCDPQPCDGGPCTICGGIGLPIAVIEPVAQ